ncbi:GNAT family N-acetyltransferase [Actinokineospora sp. HUAS TT18]|uniref:GNAT family N-acetyltransferase n=1 Tax=Actinokineospora sp. HUAS TT18 TaxID=3447451 RepID=UPI003F51F694
MSDVTAAERALHRRTALACAAAEGVAGSFRVWEFAGLLAVSATDPALAFLSTVSGVTPETEPAATEAGFVRAADRMLATRRLNDLPALSPDVVDADDVETFSRVLLAGYEVDGVVAAFIGAEHRMPGMRRFLVIERGTPIAAAAMTIHGGVAVLGSASTLPAHRGKGAQSRLLQRRLQVAARAGCGLAVATASPDSTSEANLRRAGFTVHRRATWRRQ